MGQPTPKILPFPNKGIAQSPGSASNIDVNASSAERQPALSEPDLQAAVLRIVLYGTFRESQHSAHDRSYRQISHDDIVHMLEGRWTLAKDPDWDDVHRNWEYEVLGHDIEGEILTLKIAVNVEEQMITIITKY